MKIRSLGHAVESSCFNQALVPVGDLGGLFEYFSRELVPAFHCQLLPVELLRPRPFVVLVVYDVELFRFLIQHPSVVHLVLQHVLRLVLLLHVPLLVLVLDHVLHLEPLLRRRVLLVQHLQALGQRL